MQVPGIVPSYDESNSRALRGSSELAFGGGMRVRMASRIFSTPFPLLADIGIQSSGLMPNVDCICAAMISG